MRANFWQGVASYRGAALIALAAIMGGCATPPSRSVDVAPAAAAAPSSMCSPGKPCGPPRPALNGRTVKSPENPRRTGQAAFVSATRPDASLERLVARSTRQSQHLFNPTTPVRRWRFIVLHHSGEAAGGLASIDRFHRETNGWDECGYHFVIGNGSESGDGEIEVGTRWLKQKHGAHTKPPGHDEYNEEGIGICLVGNFNHAPPTPKQVEACRRLVAFLQARCAVPPGGVITHGDADGAKTDCPGRYFPRDRLIP